MHNGCVLCGAPGVGKSYTALMYYYTKVCRGIPQITNYSYKPMEKPKDLYIVTTARKRNEMDWYGDAAEFGISRESNNEGIQVHVDSWNNISQYELVTDAFFIFDENRIVGSGAWVKSFLKIVRQNEWVLLSGTPGDVWMDFLPLFLANGFYRTKTQFVEEHVEFDRFAKYPKVRRYHNEKKLEYFKSKLLVDMPFERHTVRNDHLITVSFDKNLFERATKGRWHVYENRPLKDAGELQIVMRKIVNTDPSRWGEVQKALEEHPRLILFYNFNYELDMLRQLSSSLGIPVAEWNGHKHEPIPTGDSWLYLVQYTAGAEAWNCIETNAILFWSLPYSYKIFDQSKGRVDRLNTPYKDLHYYILRSTSQVDNRIWQSLLTKKNFNERRYAQEVWDDYVPF